MTTINTDFTGAQEVPYVSIPSGWVKFGTWQRLTSLGGKIRGNTFGQLVYNTYASGFRSISAPMSWGSSSTASEWALAFLNASQTGFSAIVKNSSITLRKEVAGVGGATIATLTTTNTADANFTLEFDDSTGGITFKKAGVSVLTGTYTDTPNLFPAIQSYINGNAQSFSTTVIQYAGVQTVTSINGGSPITASQSTVSAVTTGFGGLPTSITTNAAGVTCSDITGTTNAPSWTQTVRTDGAVFPKSGTTVNFTFVNGSESASKTQVINKDATETEITVNTPVLDDDTYAFSAIKTATGRTAVNGDIAYVSFPPAMLTNGVNTLTPAEAFLPNGEINCYNAGTFTLWVWTLATGVNYRYDITVSEAAADTTPDAFTFGSATNANLNTDTTGPTQATIAGVTAGVDILATPDSGLSYRFKTSSGGTFGSWLTTASNVQLGYVIEAKLTSSSSYNTLRTLGLNVGGTVGQLSVTTRAADTTPSPFSFGSRSNVQLSTVTPSLVQVTVAGVDGGIDISAAASGGLSYRVSTDGGATFGAWTTSTTNVRLGHVIEARVTSSSSYNTAVVGTLTIGGVAGTFTVTTRVSDTAPDDFSFESVRHVTPTAVITSPTTVTVAGVDAGLDIATTASGGLEYRFNSGAGYGAWTTGSSNVRLGYLVQVRLAAPATAGQTATGTLTMGGVSGTFSVTAGSSSGVAEDTLGMATLKMEPL